MKIELSKGDFKAATQNWNKLTNIKNRNKNYYVPTTIEDFHQFDKHVPQIKVNSRVWILLEDARTALFELVGKIQASSNLKRIVSYRVVYEAVKKELEAEVFSREQKLEKREFSDALESIQQALEDKVNHFGFFFVIEGLELKDVETIQCGNVEIFIFNQRLFNQLIDVHLKDADEQNLELRGHTQEFFDKNFLDRLCIKSTAYGDFDVARRQAYKQAREVINYFRFVLCLFTYKRISEQMVKVHFLSEAYGNGEKILSKKEKGNEVILVSGYGRKPLQSFPIDAKRLQNLSIEGFLDDFVEILNADSQTQIEGCILTSIYWIGEAQNEVDLDVAFLKYWTALECIFTGSEKPTHALAKGVSTINTFSDYNFIEIENAKEVYKAMTKLYDKRSDIIHRGMNYLANQVINEADISEICKYTAWSILSLFHLRSIGYTTMSEVLGQINKLYAQWNSYGT
jgi:hypothetical protein